MDSFHYHNDKHLLNLLSSLQPSLDLTMFLHYYYNKLHFQYNVMLLLDFH